MLIAAVASAQPNAPLLDPKSLDPKSLDPQGPAPQWPSFRGPQATGHAPDADPPITWDIDTGENVRWRTPIPGLAHSSPVIAGDRLFVTTAVRESGDAQLKVGLYGDIVPVADEGPHEFRVIALDRRTGDILWDRLAVRAEPKIKRHTKGSHAASTPATDGHHVVALFASEGLYAFDSSGNPIWHRDLGTLDSGYFAVPAAQWGFASSPVIHNGRVYVQCDIQQGSFIAALDLKTGEDIWRTPRREVPGWGTPTITVHSGTPMVICNGWKEIAAYHADTGERLWATQGGGDIPVPTPVVAGDHAYITNAHGPMAPIVAVRLDARGEFALSADSPQVAWMHDRRGNYMQTPVVIGDTIFLCSDAGIVSAFNRITGINHFRDRLGSGQSGFTASPVAAADRIYYTGEAGEVHVIAARTDGLTKLAENDLGSTAMATPAIAGHTIYWRTRGEVVAIGRE